MGFMDKLKRDDKGGAGIPVVIALVLAIFVGWMAFGGGFGGVTDSDGTPDVNNETDGEKGETGETFVSSAELSLANWSGTDVTSSDVKAYIVPDGEYEDKYQAFDELNDNGLESIKENQAMARANSPDGDGVVTFDGVVAKDTGTTYDVFVVDEADGVGSGKYNMKLADIVVEGYKDNVGNDQVSINSVNGNAGQTMVLYDRGDIEAVDDVGQPVSGYNMDVSANKTVENKQFGYSINVTNDYAKAEDVAMYFTVVDDYVTGADMTLDSVTVDDEEYSLTKVSDLDSDSPLAENKPTVSAGEGSTDIYVVKDTTFDIARITSTNKDTIPVTLQYDGDFSTAPTDGTGLIVNDFVTSSQHKDAGINVGDFTFKIGENITNTGDQTI